MGITGVAVAAPAASPSPIESTQDPSAGPDFVGSAAEAQPLASPPVFDPQVSNLHGDSGNTKALDRPGPLGSDLEVTSAAMGPTPLLWLPDGRLTGVSADSESGRYAITALDPKTLASTASWVAPEGQTLNAAYMYQKTDGEILVSSREGHIDVLQREDDDSGTTKFTVKRDIDLAAKGVLGEGEQLLTSAFDSEGNIWFSTGRVGDVISDSATSATIGYVDESDKARALHLDDQVVENGLAVSGTTAYVVTGPAGENDHANATGQMYALGPGNDETPEILWDETYDAGDASKPGGFARGSGTTPTLLGDQYVAITDSANDQVNVRVYRQQASGDKPQLVCTAPLFSSGASATEISMVGYVGDGTASLVAQNAYNEPPINYPADDGPDNDMNGMSPGVQRIDVTSDGKCETKWNTPERIKSVPVLSTQTGLIYGYGQDAEAAADGTYVWYVEALDFRTGEVVWKKRVGAGGGYNDMYQAGSLSPSGTFYQGVTDGVVTVKDGGGSE
ncbi:hypothetical protein [Streptomyces sp. NPDC046862]|uniref:hypothetical protein n=1 Tax=Streptomyces sp. NPDC046862 TaxID=3154603 RepID=UPI003451A7F4